MMHAVERVGSLLVTGFVCVALSGATAGTAAAQPSQTPASAPFAPPGGAPAPGAVAAPSQPAEAPDTTRAHRGLLVTGAVGGGISYGMALGTSVIYLVLVYPFQASFSDDDTPYSTPMWLAVPIAGPLMAAQSDFAKENPQVRTLFYVDAAVQGASLALILTSMLVRESTGRSSQDRLSGNFWLLGPGPEATAGLSFASSF